MPATIPKRATAEVKADLKRCIGTNLFRKLILGKRKNNGKRQRNSAPSLQQPGADNGETAAAERSSRDPLQAPGAAPLSSSFREGSLSKAGTLGPARLRVEPGRLADATGKFNQLVEYDYATVFNDT